MPATFLLPCVTVNTLCCQKQKVNHWPQSNYISRPAGCPLCVFYPSVNLHCGYCVYHKGILSPPSWSYQSLAELYGVGKVIHTAGGGSQILTADTVLCHFSSSQACGPLVFGFPLFSPCLFHVWKDSVEVRSGWHFISVPETESKSNRLRGRIA